MTQPCSKSGREPGGINVLRRRTRAAFERLKSPLTSQTSCFLDLLAGSTDLIKLVMKTPPTR